MDIRKFCVSNAAASGSKAPRSPAKTSIGREKSASFTPSNKRSQKMAVPKGAVLLLSSDESDGESPLTPDVKKEVQQQQRRRAVLESDDDDLPMSVSQVPPVHEPSLIAGTSKGVKRKPLDAAAPEPKRPKKATIQIDSDSEVELPGDDSEQEQVAEKKKGRRRRTPPGMQKLDAFTMKGYKDKNAPKYAPKKTAEKPIQTVDPLQFFNNFGHPSPSAAPARKKSPQKKSPAKASGISPTGEKENKAKKAASKVAGADVNQQDDAVSERSHARRTSPRKGATVERRSAEATPSKKKKTASEESISIVEETPKKKKSPSKNLKNESEVSILEETPEPKGKAAVKVMEKPKPSKVALKSPSKTSSADKAAPKSSFAPERVHPSQEAHAKVTPPQSKEPPTLPWVDKYKPSKPVDLVGQLTDKSPYNKLMSWLRNWHKHNLGEAAHEKKVKPAPFAKNDDGRAFKAALLSGPPGIGKTTSAVMACKELGLTYTELNASDARNKKKMDQMVGESLESRGLDMWMMHKKSEPTEVNHVLIMDEVDGMSGNQDRAGIAELILMMKRSKIPIICICNDRQSQKIRSLANHCFDLRFNRPQVAQIKGRLMMIISREKLKVPKELVDKIIEASNQDIRQCIYSLQLVAAGLSNEKELQQKDVSVNIFEAARRLLSSETNLMDKQEMFFTDYSIMPLFVQENYPNVKSNRMSSLEHVRALRKAADSLVLGDIIDKQIRTAGSWNLLSDQAMMSCAIPCLYLDGHLTDQLQFPSWLGRNATSGKRQRLMRQLASHTHLKISGSSHALVTDYIPVLRDRMYRPLANRENDGVPEVVALYNEYDLLRDDTEAIDELGVWPQFPDIAKSINSKTKAALTRTLNKESRLLPYALEEPIKGRRKAAAAGGGELELDEEGHVVEKVIGVDDDEAVADEEDEPSSGGGVVVKKPAGAGGKPSKTTGGTRGKGRGGRGGK